jgi:hypothetical protein
VPPSSAAADRQTIDVQQSLFCAHEEPWALQVSHVPATWALAPLQIREVQHSLSCAQLVYCAPQAVAPASSLATQRPSVQEPPSQQSPSTVHTEPAATQAPHVPTVFEESPRQMSCEQQSDFEVQLVKLFPHPASSLEDASWSASHAPYEQLPEQQSPS